MKLSQTLYLSVCTLTLLACGGNSTPSTDSSSSSSSSSNSSSSSSSNSSSASGSGVLDSLDAGDLMGWAAHDPCGPNGTTGGEGGDIVTVNSAGALKDAFSGSDPKIIYVEGKLSGVGGVSGSNKTVIGKSGAGITGGVSIQRSQNIIIKNMEISDGSDAMNLSQSTCIWLDHNTFRDGRDGNLDMVRGVDYVTVSWNKFYYTKGHSHMLSNLTGNQNHASEDRGKFKVTFHHNWWGAGVKERMPRTRHGDMHVFNNYYKYEKVEGDSGQNYNIGVGDRSRVVVENNYFDGTKDPIVFMSGSGKKVVHSGNAFVDTTGTIAEEGPAFDIPYPYTMDDAYDVKTIVTEGAGPK